MLQKQQQKKLDAANDALYANQVAERVTSVEMSEQKAKFAKE